MTVVPQNQPASLAAVFSAEAKAKRGPFAQGLFRFSLLPAVKL